MSSEPWPRGSGTYGRDRSEQDNDFPPVFTVQRESADPEEPFITGSQEAFAKQGYVGSATGQEYVSGSAYK